MARPPLDTDYPAIVSAINRARRHTGRCTIDDIARATGLTRNTAWRRVQELIAQGLVVSLGRAGYRSTAEQVRV